MNREIKFRAWDETTKEMRYPEDSRHDTIKVASAHILKHHDNVMQWTGLYDATKWESLTELERENFMAQGKSASDWNGKEIYEGDVVRCSYGVARVVYSGGCFMVEWIDDKEAMMEFLALDKTGRYTRRHESDLFEVIGNVYESYELLNQ